jgi:hypothetical protein
MRFWLVALLLVLPVFAAHDHLLFSFDQGVKDWRANVYGTGTLGFAEAEGAGGGLALRVTSRDMHGANLISPKLPEGDWRKEPYDRVRFCVSTPQPMTKAVLVFVTDEKTHPTYNLHFVIEQAGWQELTFPLGRCWNRGKQHLDARRLQRVYINPYQPDAEFTIDQIELLAAGRQVFLRPDRVLRAVPATAPPTIDGKLDDATWQTAAELTDFTRYRAGGLARDQTEARVCYDNQALYLGVRLNSSAMDKLKVEETARDAAVYQDDCVEVFVDPEHSHRRWKQFVANSIGTQFDGDMPGGEPGRGIAWNGTWTVKTSKDAKGWTAELRIPFADLGGAPKPGAVHGFNVCREAPSTGELSMWTDTGGRFTQVSGLADLVYGPFAPAPPQVEELALEEANAGGYVFRCRLDADQALATTSTVELQIPGAEPVRVSHQQALAKGPDRLAITIPCQPTEDGGAKLIWTCLDGQGQVLAYRSYSFAIHLPREASLDNLVLVPSPQQLVLRKGTFAVGKQELVIQPGPAGRSAFTAGVIQQELGKLYGADAAVQATPATPARILVGVPARFPELADALKASDAALPTLKPEGYLLLVTPGKVLVAGADDRGTYYGARTFLQLVAHATPDGGLPRAPACRIVDWPDEAFRGAMIFTSGWPQDPHNPEVLKEYIYRQVAGHKFNTLVWQMKAGYKYESYPRLANRCALTREQVRDVAQFARDHFVEIIPNTNILGHANWIVLKYKELQEDGKPHQLCTHHPETYPMLFGILDETLDVFDHPKRLHVGLDEVRWKTFNLPEDQRCPRCRGIPKYQIYADHIKRLHDYLASKGVQMWMWGDMLVPTHNGGPPFDCRKAMDLIPKDMVICNWSANHSPGSCEMLAKRGFSVVKANSSQMTLADAPYTFGNLASFWYRHPWCPFSQSGERGEMLHQAFAAEYSWHINREDVSAGTFARLNDINILRLQAPVPRPSGTEACAPVPLGSIVNRDLTDEQAGDGKGWADLGPELDLRHFPTGAITVGRAPFSMAEPRALYLDGKPKRGEARLPVGRRVASLLLLHTSVPPEDADARRTYLKRFLAPNEGVAVVELRVNYADGTQETVPVRVGMEVGFWRPTRSSEYLVRCPYLLRVATPRQQKQNPDSPDAVAYVYEWPNPHPDTPIRSVQFRHTGTEAAYGLFALSAREPK